jgi:hypothetical protein
LGWGREPNGKGARSPGYTLGSLTLARSRLLGV